MKRGRKAEPPASKAARGTLQPCRDDSKIEIIVADDPLRMPDYLTAEAELVWEEEHGRVMATGNSETDSSLFARYCSLEAMIRKAFASGEPPPAAYLTEARRMAELLGIAGRKSRVASGGVVDGGKTSNPFKRNGNRPR
ncbi:hypothetical protein D6851_02530 [Altericroceibacterium spongiae]|uniref:Terminase n=1 Tax=Altericroceibacterium spongiae TaxID=2320269 RepID=A0A420ERN3_9SPHN|nr:hypothetical protein [Altericroceibacterium spongiae]RKF23366.1 hypothetical protein D6851_02530 [Altericroceibacterium spongiae]